MFLEIRLQQFYLRCTNIISDILIYIQFIFNHTYYWISSWKSNKQNPPLKKWTDESSQARWSWPSSNLKTTININLKIRVKVVNYIWLNSYTTPRVALNYNSTDSSVTKCDDRNVKWILMMNLANFGTLFWPLGCVRIFLIKFLH